MKQKLLVIAGPTGVGKSELSVEVAKKINGEIISADSMQIYKHMDVGSAKITKDEMLGVQHYMIDVVLPSEEFSVSDFKDGGTNALKDILQKNKIPMIVGGTGLYINALTCNMNFSETDKDDDYRLELQRLVAEKGNGYVHDMLKDIDPTSFNEIHANNVKRVIRALEVYKKTGNPFSSYNAGQELYKSEYDIRFFVLTMDRNKLYEQINKRVDLMMENGLLDECIKLKEMGYNSVMQSMQGIGYKELLFYLEGKIPLKEAIEMIKQGSRNYAKRQLTWFRRDPRAIFIDKDVNTTSEIVAKIIDDMS